jgi:general L-amino acid transport system substrate-binding protein
MVRRGDDEWFAIVKWVQYGLIEAEEYGVKQANVDQLKTSADPIIQRLVGGGNEDTGKLLGLDKEWLARAIKATGNYGEIFERNVGPSSPLALPRGLNNQWNKGGLMYAYPVR